MGSMRELVATTAIGILGALPPFVPLYVPRRLRSTACEAGEADNLYQAVVHMRLATCTCDLQLVHMRCHFRHHRQRWLPDGWRSNCDFATFATTDNVG